MSKQKKILVIAACALIGGIAANRLFQNQATGGLSMGNIVTKNQFVSLIIANSSDTRGDVVLWVHQNGSDMCERIFSIDGHSQVELSFLCESSRAGQMNVRGGWAAAYPDRASTARRIEIQK